jgi:pimeloyl-ACP methyl ester carboxylesterase
MANQLRSEQHAYEYMLGRCRTERRATLARKLEAAPVTLEGGVPPAYLRVRDEAMHTLGVPVYFLHGVHDYTCTYAEASTYFDRLTAPLKGFYTFSESAHSPMFEEPDKVMTILREDMLHGTNRLADRT